MYRVVLGCVVWTFSLALLGQGAGEHHSRDTSAVPASITGVVTGPTGEFISGAQITAIDDSSSLSFQATTDTSGHYLLAEIPSGNYHLICDAKGFHPQSRTGLEVNPARVTRLDVSLPALQEPPVFCSCSILEDDFERMMRDSSPPDPEIALHISISSGLASSGSEVWLAVTLTNLASHPISVPTERSSGSAFSYGIGVWDLCNCPIGGVDVGRQKKNITKADLDAGEQSKNEASDTLRIAPGGTLTDKVELSKLLDLKDPRMYVIRVMRPDANTGKTSDEAQSQRWIISNRITLTITAPAKHENGDQIQPNVLSPSSH